MHNKVQVRKRPKWGVPGPWQGPYAECGRMGAPTESSTLGEAWAARLCWGGCALGLGLGGRLSAPPFRSATLFPERTLARFTPPQQGAPPLACAVRA